MDTYNKCFLREVLLMRTFGISIRGRVKNFSIPQTQPLLPLFEAVVNAFNAIDERKNKTADDFSPRIIIEIERDGQETFKEVLPKDPIYSISITDNGIGFDENNFKSFLESDSTYKENIGGKGVGRFSWLVAFEKACIESIFVDETNNRVKRIFNFTQEIDAIDDKVLDCEDSENKTIVKLIGYKEKYSEKAPVQLSTIATKIIQHCLIYFMSKDCPDVFLKDSTETINLNSVFEQQISTEGKVERFRVDDQEFELLHVKMEDTSISKNQLYLCANDRLVETKDLSKYITDLDRSLYEKNGFWYSGVLKGKYLDDCVDMNRLSFNIQEDGQNIVSMSRIIENAVKIIKKYLSEYLIPISNEKKKVISDYVTRKAPQYRHLIRYMPEELSEIKPNLSEEKLDDELYRIKRKFDKEIQTQNNSLLQDLKDGIVSNEDYQNRFNKQIEKISAANGAALAEYVTHRKIILDLLSEAIYQKSDGKYELEKYIHNLIYPMRSTSDGEPYENHNLWLLDEKLAYCTYISSDIPFSNDFKEDRPDILMLDNPVALSEGINNGNIYDTIIIFEIKRPMRDDYTDAENPVTQMYKYVDKLKKNTVTDKNGRIIRVGSTTKFYLYAVCDITPNLETAMIHSNILKKTPDGLGYYGYHDYYNAYIEVLPYDKIIIDAKSRNRVLFEKLGI